MDGEQWQKRARDAYALGERYAYPEPTAEMEAEYQSLFEGIDQTAYVGSRHHTVPRFLIKRWSDKRDQVQVYHRIEDRHGIANISDLAVTDFYTVIDINGLKNSIMESLLGRLEANAKPHLDAILSPFVRPGPLSHEAIAHLAEFAAFQSARTTRKRREIELQAEWFAKTAAAGHLSDDELQQITVAPHQNECIELASASARNVLPFFMCRPLAIVQLRAPLLYICDEPIVINSPVGEVHTPDCFLTEEEAGEGTAQVGQDEEAKARPRS